MNEKDFEAMLESSVSELPPEDVVAKVTPWKKAMNRVLAGMALFTITLNFLCLNYILPAVGTVLSLLGFRALRRENGWFRACFVITVIRAAYFFPLLILDTTILHGAVSASPVSSVLTAAGILLLFAGFFCLWRALRAVQRKVNLPPRSGGAVALTVWYLLMCLLAVIRYQGLIIAGAMLVIYFFILRSIYKLSKELDEAGYSVQTASVRITDGVIVLALVLTLVTGGALGYLFGGGYPMEWRIAEPSEHAEVESVKRRLAELGFPEYVLNDLAPEDIAACDGALRVVSDAAEHPVNGGRVVTTERRGDDGRRYISQSTVYDVKELRITGVGVQLPGERETWVIFHHFLWTADPGFYGTESIQLWPVYRNIPEAWASAGETTGRVLYDRDGITYVAPYHFLGNQTFTSNSIFWGEQTKTDVFAAFSMPAKGERHRGYVAYPVAELRDGFITDSWINYTHQTSWLQYPALTAMESRMASGWNDAGAFRTVQDALQFYPTEEDVELIG